MVPLQKGLKVRLWCVVHGLLLSTLNGSPSGPFSKKGEPFLFLGYWGSWRACMYVSVSIYIYIQKDRYIVRLFIAEAFSARLGLLGWCGPDAAPGLAKKC